MVHPVPVMVQVLVAQMVVLACLATVSTSGGWLVLPLFVGSTDAPLSFPLLGTQFWAWLCREAGGTLLGFALVILGCFSQPVPGNSS